MPLEGIAELEIINGVFSIIITTVSFIVGLRLSIKYFNNKIKELITVGISWMLMFTHWWGNSFSFLLYLFLGYRMDIFTYLFLENIFMPIALFLWLYSFCSLMYPRVLKEMIFIIFPLCLIEFLFILIILFIDPEILGTMWGMFDTRSSLVLKILKFSNAILFAISSCLYGFKLIYETDKKFKLKGLIFLIAVSSFLTGGLLSLFLFSQYELTFIRLLLILSSFEFYLSVFLPRRVTSWLIKGQNETKTSS